MFKKKIQLSKRIANILN